MRRILVSEIVEPKEVHDDSVTSIENTEWNREEYTNANGQRRIHMSRR